MERREDNSVKRWRGAHLAVGAAVVLILGISIALAWSLRDAPDESSHLAVVEHYAHHLGWMTRQEWQLGSARGHGYNLLSPLPYMPYLPFALVADHVSVLGIGSHKLFVTRLGGTLVAVAQLVATMALVRRICRKCNPGEVVAIALGANLVPQLRFIHAYVNADAVTILAATIAFAVLLRIVQRETVTVVDAVLVGLTLALAAHGRYNGFVVAGLLVAVFVVRALRAAVSMRMRLRLVGVAVAVPLLLAGPFHLHVYNELQNRHVLATVDNEQLSESTFQGQLRVTPGALTLVHRRINQVPDVWMSAWESFAKSNPPNYVDLRGPWLLLLLSGCALGIAGLFLGAGRLLTSSGRLVGLAAVSAFLATWVLGVSQRLSSLPGRFLLTAGIPALAAAIAGCGDLLARSSRVKRPMLVAAGSWCIVLLGCNVWAIAHVFTA
jgi:hypothetical protein